MTTDTAQRVMAIATGETRPVTQTWPDGAFSCPWCGAPNPAVATYCANPACWASKYAKPDQIRTEQERRAAFERDAEARRASAERATKALADRRAADSLKWAALHAEAARKGSCLTCLRKSDWRYRPRFVKHRNADYHEAA